MITWSGKDFVEGVNQSISEQIERPLQMDEADVTHFKKKVSQLDVYYALRSARDYGNWDVSAPIAFDFDEYKLISPYFDHMAEAIIAVFLALTPQLMSKKHVPKSAREIGQNEPLFSIFVAFLTAFMHTILGAMFAGIFNNELNQLQEDNRTHKIHICSPAQGNMVELFTRKLETEQHVEFFSRFMSDKFKEQHNRGEHATDEQFRAAIKEFEKDVLGAKAQA